MKMFDLKGAVLSLTTPTIVSILNSIELYRGKTMTVKNLKKLDALKDIARRSGAIASNYLGNVFLSDAEEKDLFETLKGQVIEQFKDAVANNKFDILNNFDLRSYLTGIYSLMADFCEK